MDEGTSALRPERDKTSPKLLHRLYDASTHRIFTHVTISLFQLAKVFALRVPGICWVRVSPSYMNISLKRTIRKEHLYVRETEYEVDSLLNLRL